MTRVCYGWLPCDRARLHTALTVRDLTLCGLTTDGSALYPTPLGEVFGDVPHQICTFHIVAEVNKAVLGAVASARKLGKALRCSPIGICLSNVT
jgi:hypothetical protein